MGMNQRENAFREISHGSQVLSYREKKEEPMLAESNLSFESRREFQASYQFHFIINPVFKVFPDLIYQSHFHMKERRNAWHLTLLSFQFVASSLLDLF
jgi:hypothetical protein